MMLTLPWPPSVNTYWRHPSRGRLAGRHLISERGRAYRDAVIAGTGQWRPEMTGRLSVVIRAYPPDRRRRDLDNMLKSLLDAMTHAGVWVDDEQIDLLTIRRCNVVPGGRVEVAIEALEAA